MVLNSLSVRSRARKVTKASLTPICSPLGSVYQFPLMVSRARDLAGSRPVKTVRSRVRLRGSLPTPWPCLVRIDSLRSSRV
jgi:hypothetical protein